MCSCLLFGALPPNEISHLQDSASFAIFASEEALAPEMACSDARPHFVIISNCYMGWTLQHCSVVMWAGPGRIIAVCQMCCGTCSHSWLGMSQRRCPASPWHARCMSSCRCVIVHPASDYVPPLLEVFFNAQPIYFLKALSHLGS